MQTIAYVDPLHTITPLRERPQVDSTQIPKLLQDVKSQASWLARKVRIAHEPEKTPVPETLRSAFGR